jgi:hypothetical protein
MIANQIAAFMAGGAPPTDYESIQTYTLTGNQTSVTFSGISSTYTHLQVRLMARGDASGFNDTSVLMQLNSDIGTNYSFHGLGGDGSSPYTFGSATQANMNVGGVSAASGLASSFGVTVIDLLDYANTNKYKTVRALGGSDRNGNGTVYLHSGSWRNTNAVTAIKIYPGNSTNFVQYSSFALYGIK